MLPSANKCNVIGTPPKKSGTPNEPHLYRKRLIGAIDQAIQNFAQPGSTASKNN